MVLVTLVYFGFNFFICFSLNAIWTFFEIAVVCHSIPCIVGLNITLELFLCIYICVYVCMYTYIHICVCMYTYVYTIYMYILYICVYMICCINLLFLIHTYTEFLISIVSYWYPPLNFQGCLWCPILFIFCSMISNLCHKDCWSE